MSSTKQTPEKGTQAARQRAPQNASRTPALDSISQPGLPLGVLVQRARLAPQTLTPRDVLQLQRLVGNRAVAELLAPKALIQPKLTVGPANDHYEQEADRVAAQVMAAPATPAPVAQRTEDEEELQAKPLAAGITPLAQRAMDEELEDLQAKTLLQRSAEGFETDTDFESCLNSARSGGAPLPEDTRQFMEQRIGADFGGVRVHTDAQAHQLNDAIQAKAFTAGQDIFFREGAYQPGSRGGRELLAHELTHVVQQGGGVVKRAIQAQSDIKEHTPENSHTTDTRTRKNIDLKSLLAQAANPNRVKTTKDTIQRRTEAEKPGFDDLSNRRDTEPGKDPLQEPDNGDIQESLTDTNEGSKEGKIAKKAEKVKLRIDEAVEKSEDTIELAAELDAIKIELGLKSIYMVELGTPKAAVKFEINPWFSYPISPGKVYYKMTGTSTLPITDVTWTSETLTIGPRVLR